LKQERVASKAKQIQIDSLERKHYFLQVENPGNPKVVGDLMNQKDNDIKVLKKKLNILEVKHVKTPELQDRHEEKEKLYQQLLER
jgi:hypothetical protein